MKRERRVQLRVAVQIPVECRASAIIVFKAKQSIFVRVEWRSSFPAHCPEKTPSALRSTCPAQPYQFELMANWPGEGRLPSRRSFQDYFRSPAATPSPVVE